MTISLVQSVTQYSGTSANTELDTVFKFFANADVVVIQRVIATGVDTTMVLGVNYNMTGGSALGAVGTVTPIDGATDFVTGTMKWTLQRLVPLTQSLDYVDNDSFPAESHEAGLDRLTIQNQDRQNQIDRALILPVSDVEGSGAFDGRSNRIENIDDPTSNQDVATKVWVQARVAEVGVTPSITVTSAGAALIDDDTADDQLTTLGGGTIGKAIFKDVNAAAVMTELTFSTFFQTLVVAASKAALRGLIDAPEDLDVPAGNLIVNPDFQAWQTGSAFASAADDSYIADQWIILSDGNAAVDIAKPADFAPGSRGGLHVTQRSGKDNIRWAVATILENSRVGPVANQKVSFSIDARFGPSGNDTLTDLVAYLISWASPGSADAPATEAISSWATGAQVKPTLVSNWSYVSSGEVALTSLTDAWQTFSFEDITVPSGALNLGILIVTMDAAFTATAEVEFSKVNLVPGSKSRKFYSESKEKNMADCQRFYCKTFGEAVVAADGVGVVDALFAYAASGPQLHVQFDFPVEMISVPTVQEYNPYGVGADGLFEEAGNDVATPSQIGLGTTGVTFHSTTAGISSKLFGIHATADARF